jgi:hypothetical protein
MRHSDPALAMIVYAQTVPVSERAAASKMMKKMVGAAESGPTDTEIPFQLERKVANGT